MESQSKGESFREAHKLDCHSSNGYKPQKSVPMKPEKIIKSHKGALVLEKENLKKFMNNFIKDDPDDHPVAFVTVIGPPESGKSFITNLIIHLGANLKDGGWLESLMKDGEFKEGFQFGSVAKQEKLFEPDSLDRITSGIYLWPTPFLMTKANKEKVYICILHYQISDVATSPREDEEAIEEVLGLTCSRMLEIMTGSEELRVAKMRRFLASSQNVTSVPSPTNACNSVVVMYSAEDIKSSPKILTDDDAKKYILDLGESSEEYEFLLDEFKHLNLMRINKSSEPLHDENGRFIQATIKPLIKPFRTLVNYLLMEEDEIIPKVHTTSQMSKFLDDCVNYVNELNSAREAMKKNVPLKRERVTEQQLQQELDMFTNSLNSSRESQSQGKESTDISHSLSFLETSVDESAGSDNLKPGVENPTTLLETSIDEAALDDSNIEADVFVLSQSAPSMANESTENDMYSGVKLEEEQESSAMTKESLENNKEKSCVTETSEPKVEESCNMEVEETRCTSAANSDESFVMVQSNEDAMEIDIDPEEVERERAAQQQQQQQAEEEKAKEKEEKKRLREEKKRRLKQEEEERLEMERKQRAADQDVMNECLPTAVLQVKKMVCAQAFYWVNVNATPGNVHAYKTIYGYCLKEVLKHNYSTVIAEYLWKEFFESVRAKSVQECESYLSILFDPVCALNTELGRQLQLYGYFPPEDFEKMAAEKATQLMTLDSQIDPKLYELMSLAIKNFLSMYNATNVAVMKSEKVIREAVALQVKNFYNKEMKRYLAEHGAFSKNEFKEIHYELTRKLLESSKIIANPTSGHLLPEGVQEWYSVLERDLNDAFVGHKESNELKLVMLQKQINKLVSARYDEYVTKMESILQKYPEGCDPWKLEKDHNDFSRELQNLLGMDVQKKIRQSEPIEGHCEALLHQINQYWPTVVKANDENIARKQTLIAEFEREQARRKNQEREELEMARRAKAQAQESRRRVARAPLSSSNVPRNSNGKRRERPNRDVQLDPLVLRLSYSHVAMGTFKNGKFELLHNHHGSPSTPILVGLNHNRELVYGRDALNSPEKYWWITDFLGSGNYHACKEKVQIRHGGSNSTYEITVEFLLGYLLKSLKHFAEDGLRGCFSTVVITVPYWFCSTHRIQVKDAAYIAGFSMIHLVNEESTAAYACASNRLRGNSSGGLLVLSENFGIVSAILYHYSRDSPRIVSMIVENFTNSLKMKSKGWEWRHPVRFIKNVALAGLALISGESLTGEKSGELDMDSKISLVRKLCSNLLGSKRYRESHSHIRPSHVIFLTDSENVDIADSEWLQAFDAVVKKDGYGTLVEVVNMGSGFASMWGASMLCHWSTDKIGEYVRDSLAHDVFKAFGFESRRNAIPKDENVLLPVKSKDCKLELQKGAKDVKFYQLNPFDEKEEIRVGRLELGHGISNTQQGYPTFELNSEAVVTLKEVRCDPIRNRRSGAKDLTQDYVWTTPNLKKQQRNDIKEFTETIVENAAEFEEEEWEQVEAGEEAKPSQENRELVEAKATLKKTCDDISEGIQEGKYLFKTDVSAELLKRKVEKARNLSGQVEVSLEDIQKEMEALLKANSKYIKPE